MGLFIIILLLKFVPFSVLADTTVSNNALVEIVDELNELVYRYDLAGGWFSESDNAKLVLTRIAMAHGDFGLPKAFGSRDGRYTAITANTPPKDKKWGVTRVQNREIVNWVLNNKFRN